MKIVKIWLALVQDTYDTYRSNLAVCGIHFKIFKI
jgi:hypothetical protein